MSACSALGDIFRSGPLPLPPEGSAAAGDQSGDNGASVKGIVTGNDDELSQRDLVTCLSKILQSAKEIKVCIIIWCRYRWLNVLSIQIHN